MRKVARSPPRLAATRSGARQTFPCAINRRSCSSAAAQSPSSPSPSSPGSPRAAATLPRNRRSQPRPPSFPPPPAPPRAASNTPAAPTSPNIVVSAEQGAAVAEKLESTHYVWTEPENLGRKINDGGLTRSPTLTADQLCLIVDQDPKGQSDLVEFRRATVGDRWGPPIYLVGGNHEERPCLSADGLQLIYNSTYPQGAKPVGGFDLYLRRRPTRDAPWGPPELLDRSQHAAGRGRRRCSRRTDSCWRFIPTGRADPGAKTFGSRTAPR